MKDRTEKELLKLLLKVYKSSTFKNVVRYGSNGLLFKKLGLCNAIVRLHIHKVINLQENIILWEHIHKNSPKPSIDVYWWPKGEVKPRIEFLKQLISEL